VLVVPASAISALGTIVLRVWYNDEDFTLMVCLQSLAGAVVIMAAAIIFEPLSSFRVTFLSVGALLYLAIFGSVLAFTGYYWLLKRMKVITLSLLAFITPVIAVGLEYLLLSEYFLLSPRPGRCLYCAELFWLLKSNLFCLS
ncbi:MAG: hypothetical protein DRP51_10945, partial [Candidatus Zixiibacteriota bacterium]